MKTLKAVPLISSLIFSPLAFAIAKEDSLAAWSQASSADRVTLIEAIAIGINGEGNIAPRRSDLRFLIQCLNDLAENGNRDETIVQATKACWNQGNFDTRLKGDVVHKERGDAEALRKSLRNRQQTSSDIPATKD